jgi:hypothetical protein
MFLLSFLHLRVPFRIPVRMPRVARATTEIAVATTRRSGRPRTVVNYASQMAVEEHEVVDPDPESPLTDLESEGAAEPPPKRKRRRRVKVLEPVVYDIPPVETKTSTFKGRSGDPSFTRDHRVYKCSAPRSIGIRTFPDVRHS